MRLDDFIHNQLLAGWYFYSFKRLALPDPLNVWQTHRAYLSSSVAGSVPSGDSSPIDLTTRRVPCPISFTTSLVPWPISRVTFRVVWPIVRPASLTSAQDGNSHTEDKTKPANNLVNWVFIITKALADYSLPLLQFALASWYCRLFPTPCACR